MGFDFFSRRKDMPLKDLIRWISGLDGDIVCREKLAAKEASFGGFGRLDPRLVTCLMEKGIGALYSHQSRAVSLALSGHDIVVVTPTASGKTLCYNLPVLDSILKDSKSRALYLFPTKALAHDQLNELEEFSKESGCAISCFTYDGDTPQSARKAAQEAGAVIVTNPDMLHSGILPHHTRWAQFFRNLSYVVVDELHMYRGVFGSHLANLFSRLHRICDFYGSHPVFICCSATIANPAEHAHALTGRHMELISESGSPSSEKEFVIYNPPLIDKQNGIRRSSLQETANIAAKALCGKISTIIFTRSRLNVELLLNLLREKLARRGEDPALVAGYRGGYLPGERRSIERGLRSGKLRGVISTNALELGIDIGSLELAILHGYPGSVASAWQQIGRVGRRGGLSAAVMVASALPLDRFLASHPEWLLNSSPERALIDAANPYIEVGHVRCSAFELPFHDKETFGGRDISEIVEYMSRHGVLRASGSPGCRTYLWNEPSYPAASVSLRNASAQNYNITDVSGAGKTKLIGSMDIYSAPEMIFPGAVYFHQGRSYVVEDLDRKNLRCRVKPASVDYYTEGISKVRISITNAIESDGIFGWGDAAVSYTPYMYKKIDMKTRRSTGHGSIDLPEERVETTAFWIYMPDECSPGTLAAAEGLSNILHCAAPLFLMCDAKDIRMHVGRCEPLSGQTAVFMADVIPGGVGLAEGAYQIKGRLIRACLDALESCGCSDGCPACTGSSGGKRITKSLMQEILRRVPRFA